MLALRSVRTPLRRQARFMSGSVVSLSDLEAVEKFNQSNAKTICYFTASWCPPCKQIKPIYEKMAEDNTNIAFAKIDVDENAEAAAEHEIAAVPTFIAVHDQEAVGRFSGADPNQLTQLVETLESK